MASIQEITDVLAQNFTFAEGLALAKPLGLFIIGLGIYAFFIFKFYRFMARREVIRFNLAEHASISFTKSKIVIRSIGYVLKHLILFPVFIFFWIIILSAILAFLAKNTEIETILLIAVALVGVVRLMAYYDEDLSKDLAKMMPFALLGVFLVDVSYFSSSNSLGALSELVRLWKLVVYYLVIIVIIEFVLRILYFILGAFRTKKDAKKSLKN